MLLSQLVGEYLCVGASHLAATTHMNYKCRLNSLLKELGPDASLADLQRVTLQRYLNRVAAKTPSGARFHLAAIRTFCTYLIQEGHLRDNPCKNIVLPRVAQKRREPVPDTAIESLLSACDRLPETEYRRALYRASLAVMVYGGLRVSEALFLRVSDVHLDTGEIFISKGKGAKSRKVYVTAECMKPLRAYLRLRPKDCEHDFLFAHNRKYGFRWHGLRAALHRLHVVAGIAEHYTPHQLRHACASRLVRNGAPLPAVSRFLGHSRLSTTEIYLHSDDEEVQSIAHLASLKPAPVAQERQSPRGLVRGVQEAQVDRAGWRKRIAARG